MKLDTRLYVGEELGLSEDELAFYDALETNDSAVKGVGGDETLRTIARESGYKARKNATIDWTLKEKRPRKTDGIGSPDIK